MVEIVKCKEGIGIGFGKAEVLPCLDLMDELLRFAHEEFSDGKPEFTDARSPEELIGQILTLQYIQMRQRFEKNPEELEELLISRQIQENPPERNWSDSMYS